MVADPRITVDPSSRTQELAGGESSSAPVDTVSAATGPGVREDDKSKPAWYDGGIPEQGGAHETAAIYRSYGGCCSTFCLVGTGTKAPVPNRVACLWPRRAKSNRPIFERRARSKWPCREI